MNRRQFLRLTGMSATGLLLPHTLLARNAGLDAAVLTLRPAPATVNLVGAYGDTDAWAYNGTVPGPEIRLAQGATLRASVENGLPQDTTVHWHGIRLPNAMDGVPHLTQPPIAPGESFDYQFALPDAGTYWYHPHTSGSEQLGRGLSGPLIVEEVEPVAADRELTWMLDDWRLEADAAIREDFGRFHDLSHGGRIGNTVTINGALPDGLDVRTGERIRIRLINAANARIVALNFTGTEAWVIATDGHPVKPFRPERNRVVLGPSMRADVLVDITGDPGSRLDLIDDYYPGRAYRLLELVHAAAPLRDRMPERSRTLPPNPLAVPDAATAETHTMTFTGGAMGGMHTAMLDGERLAVRELARRGRFWAINGVAAHGHQMPAMLTLVRGRSYRLRLRNETSWPHPIHLHGHVFRVERRNGEPLAHEEWRDSVLLEARDAIDILLVADNPGDWMFHCHIMEHEAAGMMGVIRVT